MPQIPAADRRPQIPGAARQLVGEPAGRAVRPARRRPAGPRISGPPRAAWLETASLAPLAQVGPHAADWTLLGLVTAGAGAGHGVGRRCLSPRNRPQLSPTLAALGAIAGSLLPLAADHPRGSVSVFALSFFLVEHLVSPMAAARYLPSDADDLVLVSNLVVPVFIGSSSLLMT